MNRKALLLDEEGCNRAFQQTVIVGYASDLTDDEIEQIGRDAFLVAYAMMNPSDRYVVTAEVPSRRKNDQTAIFQMCVNR